MSQADYVEKWEHCLRIIKNNVREQAYSTWFLPIKPLSYEEKKLHIQVPSQFFYEFLEQTYVGLIQKVLYRIFGEGTELIYHVMIDQEAQQTANLASEAISRPAERKLTLTKEIPSVVQTRFDSHLIENYTFNSFLEGQSNKVSRSVAMAVAEKPGKTVFNPLFIYGASGVGKTHLANAIGLKIRELYPQKRVLYVSAHLFKVQYTDSVRNNTINDFINFYQSIDVLIIDDIQELAGVTKTQNTFFHIFNQLQLNGKQLIMTSDRAPVLLQGMEERLITRFKWGMVAEIERPSLELRKAILRYKTKKDGLNFPEEVIDYIAENVTDSIRDLEGIVVSVMAYATTIYNKDIDLELAQYIVKRFINTEPKAITIDHIINTVCKHYQITPTEFNAASRKHNLVQARQIAMYLAKHNTDYSVAKIGALIGNKNHATVVHAIKMVNNQLEVDKNFQQHINSIKSELLRK